MNKNTRSLLAILSFQVLKDEDCYLFIYLFLFRLFFYLFIHLFNLFILPNTDILQYYVANYKHLIWLEIEGLWNINTSTNNNKKI